MSFYPSPANVRVSEGYIVTKRDALQVSEYV